MVHRKNRENPIFVFSYITLGGRKNVSNLYDSRRRIVGRSSK